jgi:hypothetical protein
VFCVVDTARLEDAVQRKTDGFETGLFLWWYGRGIMAQDSDSNAYPDAGCVREWFNALRIQPGGKVWIDTAGQSHLRQHAVNLFHSMFGRAFTARVRR